MAVYETNHQVPLGSVATLRVVNVFERVYNAVTTWRDARATKSALAKLSDAQLADIGLRRHHIDAVAADLARR
jgi:uncharacterized protein YjiS (DUF1127 family)